MTEPEILQNIVEGLRAAFDVKRVVLFGSRCRSAADPESDFDILAVVESDLPYRKRQGIARDAVEERVGIDADLLVLTPPELEKAMQRFDSVARIALEQGTVLYEA